MRWFLLAAAAVAVALFVANNAHSATPASRAAAAHDGAAAPGGR
ncbi:MAG TPA: hypothetical protein VJU34_01010 [Phenylobacterium sp.]|nr:hypothetical protein [Phenylobacterium sp.]